MHTDIQCAIQAHHTIHDQVPQGPTKPDMPRPGRERKGRHPAIHFSNTGWVGQSGMQSDSGSGRHTTYTH